LPRRALLSTLGRFGGYALPNRLMRRASPPVNACLPARFVMPVTAKPGPSATVDTGTGGGPQEEIAVVAGTATVLTVVTPQSAIADACTSGNC
jgi:hypothetical protein